MALRTAKNSLFATPLDVWRYARLANPSVRPNNEMENFILYSQDIIRATLRKIYESDSALTASAPWATIAIPQSKYTDTKTEEEVENSGTGRLLGVDVASTAICEMWTVTFTSPTAFDVTASFSGSQGSGDKGSEFTSTNTDIVIPSAYWSGIPQKNDVFYFSTQLQYPLIVFMVAELAAAKWAETELIAEQPNMSEFPEQWTTDVNKLLNRLQKPYDAEGLRLDSWSNRDISPEMVSYEIDTLGRDVSNYETDERARYTGDAYYYYY